jgi:tetratricopeptide (TPR) repeat protein
MSWRSALVTLFFALALMSKAMPVTLPFVFLLLDYWPLRRAWSIGLIAEKLPLLLLSVAASMVAVVTQRGAGAVVQVDFVPMLSRAANAILSYGLYLAKIVWPADLIPFYPHPYIPDTGGLQPGVTTIVGWSLLLGVISVWIARQRGRPWARVGWCWFLGTLVPVIGLVQIGRQGMADRYMYFPSIGLFIIVVWGVGEVVDRLRARPLVVAGIGLASAAALIALGATAWRQTGYWQDSISLFRHGIEIEPRNVTLRFNVANFLRDEGRLDEAVSQYRLILELTPAASGPNLNLANVLRRQGRFEEAISHYERAIAGEPDYALAHVNLASALRSVGRFDEAIAHYERALALGPSRVTLFNLANLHHARRDYAKAIDAYERALERAPADPRIHKNLGLSLLADHQVDRAITHFRQALRLQPSHADAANNLGVALEEQGRIDEAIEAYRQAIRIAPDHSRARSNLALLLESRGRVEKAPPE